MGCPTTSLVVVLDSIPKAVGEIKLNRDERAVVIYKVSLLVSFRRIVTNQGIGLRRTDTEPPCYKGNKRRTRPFGFPTGLGPDGPQEIHAVTL